MFLSTVSNFLSFIKSSAINVKIHICEVYPLVVATEISGPA